MVDGVAPDAWADAHAASKPIGNIHIDTLPGLVRLFARVRGRALTRLPGPVCRARRKPARNPLHNGREGASIGDGAAPPCPTLYATHHEHPLPVRLWK